MPDLSAVKLGKTTDEGGVGVQSGTARFDAFHGVFD